MKRRAWTVFALSFGVVLAAVAYVSYVAWEQDRRRRASLQADEREELVRLALWRMDAALIPPVSMESTRPFEQYQPEHLVTWQPEGAPRPQTMYLPSPLRDEEVPLVTLHFRIGPGGDITVPYDDMKPAPRPEPRSRPAKPLVNDRGALIDEIARINEADALVSRLPAVPAEAESVSGELLVARNTARNRDSGQQGMNINELQSRMTANAQVSRFQSLGRYNRDLVNPTREGDARAFWAAGKLFIARRVVQNNTEYVAGCLLDWPAIRSWLLKMIADLLPDAALRPAADGDGAEVPGRLAALPVRLVPGRVEPTVGLDAGAVFLPLGIAWAGVLVAGVSVAVLLGSVIALGERRSTFATAVPHELRTPLTSMRMYTEMMAAGMVDDEKRRAYLATLHGETLRLCDMVENVLAFGRMESKDGAGQKEDVTVGDFVQRLLPRIEERVAGAGMVLSVEVDSEASSARMHVHVTGVEQVVLNLVDNACKYAAGADDKRIHFIVFRTGGGIEFGVRDHGPGIDAADRKRIFRPFCKARRDEAGTRGGAGLGLALCRRIAKKNGGTLSCRPAPGGGTRFSLRIRESRVP